MKTVIYKENAIEKCALHLKDIFDRRPVVLAVDPCNDIFSVFEMFLSEYTPDPAILKNTSFFMLKELAIPGCILCRRFIEMLTCMGADPAKIFIPSEKNICSFDEMIKSVGGIDHAVIGLRTDSALLFNEVGAQFSAASKIQKQTPGIKSYLYSENSDYPVPEFVYTCGIKTLSNSENISVFVFGENKADSVYKTLYSRTDSINPAAFLQIPSNVTLYLDEEAASKL